jgi:outer membrane receptor for ferrienterochelin and colicin
MSAAGQGSTTSSMTGQVTDADGEPLPGANVIAVHQPTGTRYGASTNQSGRYRLSNLRVGGPYEVTASFVGYQSQRETNLNLGLGETQRLNFELQQKTAEMEEVSVIADRSSLLSSDRQGVSTNISTEDLEAQPTMSRSIADVARLSPQAYVANGDDDGAAISIAGQWNRFNSIYIDGAVTNDVFGLAAQGTPGGQSGASPISLSAVEAMSVDVSPFDVTKGGFVGGAINFVTKSGTNDFEGSFEYFRRGSSLTQSSLSVDGNQLVDGLPDASDDRYVFNLGGPIVEDKLFFFVNVDVRRKSDAEPLQSDYRGSLPLRGGDPSDSQLESVFEIRDFMQRNTGYNPGFPGSKNTILDSEKYLARLDYNVNNSHRLTARYYYNDNYNVDRFQSTQQEINFSNNSEVFPSKQHNLMLQWRGTFGTSVSTKTTATYQTVEDDRGVAGEPFPNMSIENSGGSISLGSEAFSYPNFLEQNVGTLTNETDISIGDHTLTVGTHNEFYAIDNRFAIFGPGSYSFDSVSNFAETVCAYAQDNRGNYGIDGPGPVCQAQYPNAEPQTDFYLRQYSLLDDDPSTQEFESLTTDDTNLRSEFNAVRLGVFLQDEWQATDRLRVTAGLRAEFPKILDDPRKAEHVNGTTLYGDNIRPVVGKPASEVQEFAGPSVSEYYDLNGAEAGEMPEWRTFLSPRFGFNYDVTGDRSTQVRGGVGVFTSRLPFVWPGGAYLNNGVSSDFLTGIGMELRRPGSALTRPEPGDSGFFFNGGNVSTDEITPTGNLILFRDDFSYPRVLRTSVAIDQDLPYGLVGTLEGQYSSKLKDVIVKNVNLKPSNETLNGPDDRPIWRPSQYEDGSVGIDGRYGDILLLDNTNEGYSYTLTAQLRKEAFRVWDGGFLRGNVSYTYGDSRSLNQFGDTVGSNWDENPHVEGTNNLTLGRSPYSLGHKVQVSMAYRQEITDNVSTNLSVFYSGTSGRPFSYTIGGGANEDMIGDGGGAPLFYIPEDVSNLEFTPITSQSGDVLRTVEQQRQDLRGFINSVDYLSENRGDYATRNADRTPFEGIVDLKFSVNVGGELLGQNQSLSLNANVFNFSSLLGDVLGTDWGRRYIQVGSFSPVSFEGFEDAENGNYTPIYQSNLGTDNPIQSKEELFNVESGTQTYSSLYQVQLGVKYTF